MWEEELFIGSYSPTPSPGERNKQAKLAIVKRSPAEDIQPCYLQFSCLLSGTELDQYLNKYLAFNFSGFKYWAKCTLATLKEARESVSQEAISCVNNLLHQIDFAAL